MWAANFSIHFFKLQMQNIWFIYTFSHEFIVALSFKVHALSHLSVSFSFSRLQSRGRRAILFAFCFSGEKAPLPYHTTHNARRQHHAKEQRTEGGTFIRCLLFPLFSCLSHCNSVVVPVVCSLSLSRSPCRRAGESCVFCGSFSRV